ncbi:MAG: hypothetical protein KAX67_04610 [Pararheinheimera sp.]|jgi:hypothetical protein|nr:hypothetical protein [Rheinheimera sp.]
MAANKKVPAEAGTDTLNYRENPDSHSPGDKGKTTVPLVPEAAALLTLSTQLKINSGQERATLKVAATTPITQKLR